jgi:hypothetical protein
VSGLAKDAPRCASPVELPLQATTFGDERGAGAPRGCSDAKPRYVPRGAKRGPSSRLTRWLAPRSFASPDFAPCADVRFSQPLACGFMARPFMGLHRWARFGLCSSSPPMLAVFRPLTRQVAWAGPIMFQRPLGLTLVCGSASRQHCVGFASRGGMLHIAFPFFT